MIEINFDSEDAQWLYTTASKLGDLSVSDLDLVTEIVTELVSVTADMLTDAKGWQRDDPYPMVYMEIPKPTIREIVASLVDELSFALDMMHELRLTLKGVELGNPV